MIGTMPTTGTPRPSIWTGLRTGRMALVRADEDVADYWLELARFQVRIGDYRGAYEAFSRAHELDRGNVDVLAAMTQIALMSGDTDVAQEHARSLALVASDSPLVTLVNGFVDYRSGEFDKAGAAANRILANAPTDPLAKILKARVLIATDRTDEAIAILEEQHRTVPEDANAIRALSQIYRARQDWRNLARMWMVVSVTAASAKVLMGSRLLPATRSRNVSSCAEYSSPRM